MQQYHRRIYTIPPKDYENSCVFQAHVSVRPDYLRMLEPEQFITQDKMQKQLRGSDSALNRLVKAILNDENAILTVSTYQNGEYNQKGMYIGVPAIINKNGVKEILELKLKFQPLNEKC